MNAPDGMAIRRAAVIGAGTGLGIAAHLAKTRGTRFPIRRGRS